MGLVGAGNVGTAVSVLIAPPLGPWPTAGRAVYAIAAGAILIPMVVMIFFAKEPPDVDAHASMRQHVACLFEKDGWAFSLIYGVTFGGFIGLITFLPTYYYDQFSVSKVQAGQLTMLAAFMGAAVRVIGGALSDRLGGVNVLDAAGARRRGHHAGRRVGHGQQLAGADDAAAHRSVSPRWAPAMAPSSNWCRCAGQRPRPWRVR